MSKFVTLHGFGAGSVSSMSSGGGVNLVVVGDIIEPSSPVENTFWINTNVEIPNWEFDFYEPENPSEGTVWFKTGITSTTPMNALNGDNVIDIYPLSAKQYIDGKWISRPGCVYYNGEWIALNTIPEFTYTGDYEIVNDENEKIESSADNWKIRFLTSGTLNFTDLKSAGAGIDVFLVGGGAGGYSYGGGGGGYTATQKEIIVEPGVDYEIVVGAGGVDAAGGQTSAFSMTVEGGKASPGQNGGNGGSGGGNCGRYDDNAVKPAGAGGSDGSDGGSSGVLYVTPGVGQHSTTREFAELWETLYAGGGGGGGASRSSGAGGAGGAGGGGAGGAIWENAQHAQVNTGGGGGAGGAEGGTNGNGGSGIVIIRNARGFQSRISITYPAGSICTCTSGDTVVTAPDTSGVWNFRLTEIGKWHISCTDGTQEDFRDTEITGDSQNRPINLEYHYWLYRDGNTHDDNIHGGWTFTNPNFTSYSSSEDGTLSFYSTNINHYAKYCTVNKVDLTNYTKLCFEGTIATNGRLGLSDDVNPQYISWISGGLEGAHGYDIYKIDISSINTTKYIQLVAFTNQGTSIRRMWLE